MAWNGTASRPYRPLPSPHYDHYDTTTSTTTSAISTTTALPLPPSRGGYGTHPAPALSAVVRPRLGRRLAIAVVRKASGHWMEDEGIADRKGRRCLSESTVHLQLAADGLSGRPSDPVLYENRYIQYVRRTYNLPFWRGMVVQRLRSHNPTTSRFRHAPPTFVRGSGTGQAPLCPPSSTLHALSLVHHGRTSENQGIRAPVHQCILRIPAGKPSPGPVWRARPSAFPAGVAAVRSSLPTLVPTLDW